MTLIYIFAKPDLLILHLFFNSLMLPQFRWALMPGTWCSFSIMWPLWSAHTAVTWSGTCPTGSKLAAMTESCQWQLCQYVRSMQWVYQLQAAMNAFVRWPNVKAHFSCRRTVGKRLNQFACFRMCVIHGRIYLLFRFMQSKKHFCVLLNLL